MALDLEYLEKAVIEAEAAAEWYAARSATAAAGFEAELGEAESAIRELAALNIEPLSPQVAGAAQAQSVRQAAEQPDIST